MRAGLLRSKIDLMRLNQTQDSAGGLIDEWVTYATVRCEDRVTSTKSLIESGMDINQEIHTFRMRHRCDIKPSDRVKISDGRILDIVGYPKPLDQKRREIIITAVYHGE